MWRGRRLNERLSENINPGNVLGNIFTTFQSIERGLMVVVGGIEGDNGDGDGGEWHGRMAG